MSAFSQTYKGRSSEIRSSIGIASSLQDQKEAARRQFTAIWDTGANATSISNRVAKSLALVAIDHVSVETANGKCDAPIYLIDVILPNGHSVKCIEAMGTNLNVCDALIGMDIITQGDMLITNAPNTRFEFRLPSRGAPSLQ